MLAFIPSYAPGRSYMARPLAEKYHVEGLAPRGQS
jgi:hypothetical protein